MAEPEASTEAPAEELDPAGFKASLDRLAELLGEGDPEAEDLLGELRGQFAAAGQSQEYNGLVSQVENFDFEEALESLKTIAAAVGGEPASTDPPP